MAARAGRNRRAIAIWTAGVLLAVVLRAVPAGAAPGAAAAFNDISQSPYAGAITYMARIGVATGFPDGSFRPQARLTREEFAAFAVRLMGQDALAQATASVTPRFADASAIDRWAYGYVDVAQTLGLFRGYADGFFGPQRAITEGEAATVLVRVMNGDAYARNLQGPWPANYVQAAADIGLLGPSANNRYRGGVVRLSPAGPDAPAARGEVAQMLYNAGVSYRVVYIPGGGAVIPCGPPARCVTQFSFAGLAVPATH